tara:strand:- start:77 stop:286 length:210 start_codon:yes stop_codon:yes gene_type:complete
MPRFLLHILSNKKQPNLKNFYFCGIFATDGKKLKAEGSSVKKQVSSERLKRGSTKETNRETNYFCSRIN